jgi:hypothetical protein
MHVTAEQQANPKLGFLRRIFKWLRRNAEKCADCGAIGLKEHMVHKPGYGYFCDESHFQDYFDIRIW